MTNLIEKVKGANSVKSYNRILKSAMKRKISNDSKKEVAKVFIDKAEELGDQGSRLESFVFAHKLGVI